MKRLLFALPPMVALLLAGCSQPTAPPQAQTLQLPAGNAGQGRAAFIELQCSVCHKVAGWKGQPVPWPTIKPAVPVVLGTETRKPTRMERINAIIAPSHKIKETMWPERTTSGTLSRMADYNDVLTMRQLADILAFLEALNP